MPLKLPFRIVNVFTRADVAGLSGNPLCVFEDGSALTDAQVQALALQTNLSETTFLLPSATATKRVRIFTPSFEMPFAGHPTLGSAHVVRSLLGGDQLTLEMKAGIIPVSAVGDLWTLTAQAAKTRSFDRSRAETAAMLGLPESDLASSPPLYVDTGSEQFVVQLSSPDAVRRAKPEAAMLQAAVRTQLGRYLAYVFSPVDEHTILSRFFFPKNGGLTEDPGTGSACANLGGYLQATGLTQAFERRVLQGEQTGQPCELFVRCEAGGPSQVSGTCVEVAQGFFSI